MGTVVPFRPRQANDGLSAADLFRHAAQLLERPAPIPIRHPVARSAELIDHDLILNLCFALRRQCETGEPVDPDVRRDADAAAARVRQRNAARRNRTD